MSRAGALPERCGAADNVGGTIGTDLRAQQAMLPHDKAMAGHVLWLCAAAVTGFLVPFITVHYFAVSRDWYVLFHVVASGGLCLAYATWSRTSAAELIGDAGRGLRGALASGTMMIAFVLAGPSSSAPSGLALFWSLMWLGIAYAIVDASLLSVLPVLAVQRITSAGSHSPQRRFALALAASLLVTAAYHLGFPEFQGPRLLMTLVGNGILSLAYLATRSVIAPILGHVMLHLAAVIYGYSSALPVPPHY